MTVFVREPPWSLLRTQWLDVPIGADDDDSSPTWAVFSEAFEGCLRSVSSHVARRVVDRKHLECIVTEVLVGNLDVLVSRIGRSEKIRHVVAAADMLLARDASARPGGTDVRTRSDRDGNGSNRDRDP